MVETKTDSISNQLSSLIKPGQLLFSSDYMHLGNAEAVNMAFSRLAKKGKLERLGKGIYLNPKQDEQLGFLYPSLETVAEAIASKEKVIIKPTGASALNKLGLSTQVPTKVNYLTDGNPRKIKVGKGVITFMHTTPKKLATEGKITFLVIQALLELGKEVAEDEKVLSRIYQVLKKEGYQAVINDAKKAPGWVAKILYSLASKMKHHD